MKTTQQEKAQLLVNIVAQKKHELVEAQNKLNAFLNETVYLEEEEKRLLKEMLPVWQYLRRQKDVIANYRQCAKSPAVRRVFDAAFSCLKAMSKPKTDAFIELANIAIRRTENK